MVAKRVAKRIAVYKAKLVKNLPSQIELWKRRESRLLNLITGKSGVSIAALLVRECPDPPEEIDPDTDDEESKHEDENIDTQQVQKVQQTDHEDPTIRMWAVGDTKSTQALDISEKQRVRLQQQAMAMSQYCSMMKNRASSMLRFINKECPGERGDVMTLFRDKYPHYGLRWIARDVCEKMSKFTLSLSLALAPTFTLAPTSLTFTPHSPHQI